MLHVYTDLNPDVTYLCFLCDHEQRKEASDQKLDKQIKKF